jgi:hypothetical protein
MSWTFRYTKDNDDLTNPPISQSQTQPQTQSAASGGTSFGDSNWLLAFVTAFVALLAVGGAAFWVGRSTRSPARGAWAGRERSGPPSEPQAVDAAFCYRCGAELRPDADFCHKCGAPVRG